MTLLSNERTAPLPAFDAAGLTDAARRFRDDTWVVADATGRRGVAVGAAPDARWPVIGQLPGSFPEWLGDRGFTEAHGLRFPYVAGAMANGIASIELVEAMARAGMLGFFGAAGLSFGRVRDSVAELTRRLGRGHPGWGSNLIHSPNEPELEERVAELYLEEGVSRVSAAAYMKLTPAIVRYAVAGLSVDPQGRIQRSTHVFAKVSRPEVARHFLRPAPTALLAQLVQRGWITGEQARLAEHVAVAEDITAESDSGGHTDNRPLAALLPTLLAERDAAVDELGLPPSRIGAAGGLGTPAAVASAFALGAAYVLTGSVNQACVESGLSADGKRMLAVADLADVVMAPAADMFELGVEVQVLKRGTMFASRAHTLYELYRAYPSLEAVPADARAKVEKSILLASFDEAWASTRTFWSDRDPREVERAERDPHHKMALVFRSYLGLSSRWAIAGEATRRTDFQIWCGPAMGAFNAWTKGSFLAEPEQRSAPVVARNLLEGACQIARAQQLRAFGVAVPASAFRVTPRHLA